MPTDSEIDLKKPEMAGDKPADAKEGADVSEKDMKASAESSVKDWNKKISNAREKFSPDFKRFDENMKFVSGRQWPGQETIAFDKYVSNITFKVLKGIEAQLYAKNPKCSVERRKRMDFEIWDEKVESLQQASMVMSTPVMALTPQEMIQQLGAKMQAQALMQDVQIGQQWRKIVDKVASTLEICYAWQIDNLQPGFKKQAKQAVMRALTCFVAYCRVDFSRTYEGGLNHTATESTISDRAKRAKLILEKLEKKEIQGDSKEIETLRQLTASMGQSVQNNDLNNVNERICWDWPSSTSIIPDPACTNLDGFIGCDWICEEMYLSLDNINAYFETQIGKDEVNKGSSKIGQDDKPSEKSEEQNPKVCLRHVWQLSTKSHFFIIAGYDKFVMEPEPVSPETNRFWPVHTLIFNNIEINDNGKNRVSIFGPSHVDLIRAAQEEWNRCRETLRDQRKANQPKYCVPQGKLTEKDKDRLTSCEPNQIVELQGLTPEQDVNKVLTAFKNDPIRYELYDTSQSMQDIQLTTTSQAANLGSPGKRETATGETIAEQSRTSILSSNVDNLDEFLSGMAQQVGEILLREMSPQTAKRIAGRGAVWPSNPQEREEFIQAMWLDIKAASSGRPNQQLHISNAQKLGPLMLQAGANPVALVEEYAKALDENLDFTKFFPTGPPQVAPAPGGPPKAPQPKAPGKPQGQPPHSQALPNHAPVQTV